MRKIISISETFEIPHSSGQVQASADTFYDEAKGEMEVNLKVAALGNEEIKIEGCGSQTVKQKISLDEVIPAAKDIFHSWIQRILQTGAVAVPK